MKVKTSDGRILESSNELVTGQWKKQGLAEYKEKKASVKSKETRNTAQIQEKT